MYLFSSVSRRCTLAALASTLPFHCVDAHAAAPATPLAPLTVTGTRERALLSETPSSVAVIDAETVRLTAPTHPSQLLGQVPGVAVAVTNGEGHTTAIRQPFTTNPVYLFLEDGLPLRATGFFNHNALYEVNVPMAGGIEVVRGPGTALYGSDAIGGIVNVLTRTPSAERHAALSAEAGAFGSWRFLGSGGGELRPQGDLQLDLNLTHTDGWRDRTAYDRQSANLRFDQRLDERTVLKTVAAFSKIDQETGANSALPLDDYLHDPTRNNFAIAYRKVSAVRLSVEYERQFGSGMLSLLPYFRDNAMELNGTFNLSSDPRIEQTHNVSYGVLAKFRQNLPFLRARAIGGLDLDYSPGSRQEDNLLVTRSGTGASTRYTDYTLGTRLYDYEVTFRSASPYVHTELSPLPALRLTAGLRYDSLHYAMRNHLPAGTVRATVLGATRYYGQVDRNDTDYSRVSPKLGATYALGGGVHLYGSYHYGFRAPSESQLYRAGNDATEAGAAARARLALALKPIKARQAELGLRGDIAGWSWSLVGYELRKQDDLVSQRDLATNVSTSVNAGQTRHRGLELGLGARLGSRVRLDTAISYARHRYLDWRTATADNSGREIETAPRILANTRLTVTPLEGLTTQLEWVRIGSYWLEASNSATFGKYDGHDLLNLRARYAATRRLAFFARLMNVADTRFAESASVSSNTRVFSPGLPRALYGGVELAW